MSDSESNEKKGLAQVTDKINSSANTPFFTFSKPYLDFIGKGTMYNLVYIVMAVINLILPFAVIFMAAEKGVFNFKYVPVKLIIAFIFLWLFVAFACWIGFQLWWDRKSQVKTLQDAEFVATPIVADIFRTFGEWLGTLMAIIGVGGGLTALIFRSDYEMRYMMGFIPGLNSGALAIVAGPVAGFFTIIFFRFLAELLKIAVALANNIKEIAVNLKK
ncbi:MAG: hypothetical protein LBH43_08985 [Treponema sp.]|jgi:hypothetical protein|nr:hypothetical protein [Treponema sp.]